MPICWDATEADLEAFRKTPGKTGLGGHALVIYCYSGLDYSERSPLQETIVVTEENYQQIACYAVREGLLDCPPDIDRSEAAEAAFKALIGMKVRADMR